MNDPDEIRTVASRLSTEAGMNEDLQVFGLAAYLSLQMNWNVEKATDAIAGFLAGAELPMSVGLDFLSFLAARQGSVEEFESFYQSYAEEFRLATSPPAAPVVHQPQLPSSEPVRVTIEVPAKDYDAAGAWIAVPQLLAEQPLGACLFKWWVDCDGTRFTADVFNTDSGPQLSIYAMDHGSRGCRAAAPTSRDLTTAHIFKLDGKMYEVCVSRRP